tara:strand:+ start:1040 stop:1264 length:225 start_codon:yes stop_codon:yes gene_type:complete
MIKTSTNYDIVKYIYDELEEKKIEKFKFKINTDSSAEEEYNSLSEIKYALDEYIQIPSDRVIKKIKEYSYNKPV